ncbi:MAG TPA: fructose-6-phosphate aldolase [Bacteroidia bacterium]|jgi:hypothetical protein|nr:fructose-6-phosphate aldolase [Bacteroidia bacterium]HQF29139.1 fructose-6-phosphate aldolase [Bacteroidia bacterium]HQK98473.1 fructose-6-phosphate aldolase [Bacteroidia bacterium]
MFALAFMKTYYLLKIKGKAKIPDYVQMRDDQFTLLAYFRLDRPEKSLTRIGLGEKEGEILSILEKMQFGKVQKIEL